MSESYHDVNEEHEKYVYMYISNILLDYLVFLMKYVVFLSNVRLLCGKILRVVVPSLVSCLLARVQDRVYRARQGGTPGE